MFLNNWCENKNKLVASIPLAPLTSGAFWIPGHQMKFTTRVHRNDAVGMFDKSTQPL